MPSLAKLILLSGALFGLAYGQTSPSAQLQLVADQPLHRIVLKSDASFETVAKKPVLDIYPASVAMKRVFSNSSRKTIEAATCTSGIEIKTKAPREAVLEILGQIAAQTNRPLGKFIDTRTAQQLAPATALMAWDSESVWFLLLTPKSGPDTYLLTCSYLIDGVVPPESFDHLAKMIACEEADEPLIEDAFNAYHLLLATRELKAGELRFPAHLTKTQGDTLVLDRAFYISPNVLRGFELIVPATCMTQKGEAWIAIVPLTVEKEQTRQGITSLRLKGK